MIRLPTVSEISRAAVCDASVALERNPPGPPSPAALRGQRIHAWIAANLRGWALPDIGKTKVDHINLQQLRDFIGDGELLCEAAFSFDGEKAEYLGENLQRDYDRPGTLCGAADILSVGMMVVDIKTGSFPVPPPADNWQLSTLVAMANVPHGAIATLARDGSWTFDKHTWALHELDAIRERLRGMMSRWHGALEQETSGWGATKTPGRHCRWCPTRCEFVGDGTNHETEAISSTLSLHDDATT